VLARERPPPFIYRDVSTAASPASAQAAASVDIERFGSADVLVPSVRRRIASPRSSWRGSGARWSTNFAANGAAPGHAADRSRPSLRRRRRREERQLVRIEGEHRFLASREQVWRALHDSRVLTKTLPGLHTLEATGKHTYAITASAGVGSIKGLYGGTFSLTDRREPASCTVRASAQGSTGSFEAVARMRLAPGPNGGAALRYEADANVTGALAGVGQRLIGAAAQRTTRQFLDALDREITRPQAEASEPGRTLQAAAAPAPAPSGDPLRLVATGAPAGFALALIAVAVGRRTAAPRR
jgi:carbon monoxide dehydrogenase subunit G